MVMTSSYGNGRISDAKLKRAAGSHSLSQLQEAIATGWSATSINAQEGKSALHLAAWKGSLENVQYLVDEVGCDINAYSTGDFNYGKTAIFYASTQSREDVVDFLLRRGAKVTIVNNKGQSVLSLCATHEFCPTILARIESLEEQQGDWWNFLQTHSDGLEYGDLDPRFHSARDTDIITKYAINPTSKQTRKGGFAMRNPEQYEALTTRKKPPKKERNKQKRQQTAELTVTERKQLEDAWKRLEADPWLDGHSDHKRRQEDITTIITLNDKQFKPWLPAVADRLEKLVDTSICTREQVIALLDYHSKGSNDRYSTLVQKLLIGFQNDAEEDATYDNIPKASTTFSSPEAINWDGESWRSARDRLHELSINILEGSNLNILHLPQSPMFVSLLSQVVELQKEVSNTAVIALDTEWHNTDENRVAISTLQVALVNSNNEICTYVVDLLVDESLYQNAVQSLTRAIFASCAVIIGFAFVNDVPFLEEFLGSSLCLQRDNFVDVQQLYTGKRQGEVPGLAACAAQVSTLPLLKDQQCSQWGNRPLSPLQLEYAGLDAAILLVLLAEHLRRVESELSKR